jgi:RHS repeat-associated protein
MKTKLNVLLAALLSATALLSPIESRADTKPICGNTHSNTPPCPPDKCCPKSAPSDGVNIFNTYNSNVTRSVTDLVVWGSVGDNPLAFTRFASSRLVSDVKWFGQSQNWRHSYQYDLVKLSDGRLRLYYPDGNVETYSGFDGTWWYGSASNPDWLAQGGPDLYLYRADGSFLHFVQQTSGSTITYTLTDMADAHSNTTALAYDASGRLSQITEPGGRWLKITYADVTVNQSQFTVLGYVSGTPPSKTWTQINVGDTNAYRYLRYYSTDAGCSDSYCNIAEMEFYDKAGNKLSGTPFGTSPAYNNSSNTFAKASDGNTGTYFDYAFGHMGFTGIDLGAGNAKAIGSIRFYPRAGYESRMNGTNYEGGPRGCRFEGSNVAPVTVTVIAKVESSDGRSVTYNYTSVPDTVLTYSWLVLAGATYGDGTAASYHYTLQWAGQPPLLTEADDPRYEGAGVHMKYQYWGTDIYGEIYKEFNGVTGSVLTTLTGAGAAGTNVVTYPNGKTETVAHADNGMVSQRTDGLGRVQSFTYTSSGQGFLASDTDPLGRTTSYTRDDSGNLLSQTNPDGGTESWTRDDAEMELTHTDALGHTTTITRDVYEQITRIDYPDGSFEAFTYNNFSQVLTHTLRGGGTESNEYDARGLKTSHTDAAGNKTAYTYNANDLPATATDAAGHATAYEYTERGLLSKVTYADGSAVSYTYDKYGDRASVTNELGNAWTYAYDEFKRLTGVTDPLGRTTTYTYAINASVCGSCHSDNKPTQITLPSGKITKIVYDVEWQKTSETVGYGSNDAATTGYAYDSAGNLITMTDPRGKVWRYTYDTMNRRASAADPLNNKTQWTYDKAGNRLTETRPDNGVTTNVYDAMNRLASTKDPKNQTTTFAYGGTGASGSFGDNLISLTDARNNTYSFTYDSLNRKTSMVYPDQSKEQWSYDASGNLATYTTRAGQVKTSTFDNRNRETGYSWSDGVTPAVSMAYDAAGRLTSLSSSVSSLSYTYDKANQLLSETSQLAGGYIGATTVSYSYDADGNRASVTYPSGHSVTYAYTNRNQVASLTADGPPPIATYTYDLSGNRLSKNLENGTSATYAYDDANKLLTVNHQKGSASFDKLDYAYNAVNNRTSRTETTASGSAADAYSYDAIDQVTGVNYGSGRSVTYAYDAVGNRTSVVDYDVFTAYAANSLNQYTSINGMPVTAYDANGNLTSYRSWTYTYDAQNRLISASGGPNNVSASFAYDARNRCVLRVVNSAVQVLVYDGWNLLEEYADGDSGFKYYVHGAQTDELIAVIIGTESRFYHQDALGSTTSLSDASGNLVERYSYDVYGAVTVQDSTGNVLANGSTVGNRFLFTGREWIKDVNLYDYRNRVYSQELGRFLQIDLASFDAGDINFYRYVKNNVVDGTDPEGLFCHFMYHATLLVSCGPKGSWQGPWTTVAGYSSGVTYGPAGIGKAGYLQEALVYETGFYRDQEFDAYLCCDMGGFRIEQRNTKPPGPCTKRLMMPPKRKFRVTIGYAPSD